MYISDTGEDRERDLIFSLRGDGLRGASQYWWGSADFFLGT